MYSKWVFDEVLSHHELSSSNSSISSQLLATPTLVFCDNVCCVPSMSCSWCGVAMVSWLPQLSVTEEEWSADESWWASSPISLSVSNSGLFLLEQQRLVKMVNDLWNWRETSVNMERFAGLNFHGFNFMKYLQKNFCGTLCLKYLNNTILYKAHTYTGKHL